MPGGFGFRDAIYWGVMFGGLAFLLQAVAFDERYHLDVFAVSLAAFWFYFYWLCRLTERMGRPRRVSYQ